MEKIKTIIVSVGMVFAFAYLMGSFAQASFNIAEWSDESRGTISVVILFLSILVSAFALNQLKD